MSRASSNPFSGGIVAAMIGVGLLAFVAIFALIGWAPELASKTRVFQFCARLSRSGYATGGKRADGQRFEAGKYGPVGAGIPNYHCSA